MAIEKTIKINIDTSKAEENLENINEGVEELGESAEQTAKDTSKLADAFTGMGMVWKNLKERAINFVIDGVTEAMMNNQRVADRLNATNESMSILFNDVATATVNVIERIIEAGISFEALGKVASSSMKLNLVPVKLLFLTIKSAVLSVQLAWENSFFNWGKRDKERIAELTENLKQTAIAIKDTGVEAFEAGKELVTNYSGMIEEFQQLGEIVNEEFSGVIDYTAKELIEMGEEIVSLQNEVLLAASEQEKLKLESQKNAEIQRQIRDDIRLNIDERIAANEELARILEEQYTREVEQANKRLKLAKLESEADSENIQKQAELKDAQNALLEIEERITSQRSEQRTNEAALHDERMANLQELSTVGKKEEEDARNALKIEAENRVKLAERTISDEQELKDMLIAIEADYQRKLDLLKEEEAKKDKEISDAKFEQANKRVDQAQDIMNSLAQIRQQEMVAEQNALDKQLERGIISEEEYEKKSAKIEKEALKREKRNAKFQILIDTAQGIAAAIKAGAGVPFPANLGAILSGIAAVVAGIAQAKAVMNKVPGGGGGDDDVSVSEISVGGIGGTIPNMEAITPTGENGLQPVQAYVVENDISNAQALQEELDIQATL